MEIPKLIILLFCTYYTYASEHGHTIPVEGYETDLKFLGQHVEIPETPVKVVKITKTVAVKVPVPYPVKVIQKVPYPVHVAKPYPVPVPQIVHVPQPVHYKHEAADSGAGHGGQQGNSYQVQESPYESFSSGGQSFHPLSENQSYEGSSEQGQNLGGNSGEHSSEGSFGGGLDSPNHYFGYSGDNEGHGSFESKSYDQALNNYLQKQQPSGNSGNFGYHFH